MAEEDEQLVKDIWNRKGRVLIGGEFLEESPVKLVEQIMSNLIVLRCEHAVIRDKFRVDAVSRRFDAVPPNTIPPRYDVEITRKDNDEYEINFEKYEGEEVEVW